ncbi:hypothetical protein A2U01_0009604, partial [Trifolium medium]|nr:hypothetical protein [Trifolium medium]
MGADKKNSKDLKKNPVSNQNGIGHSENRPVDKNNSKDPKKNPVSNQN